MSLTMVLFVEMLACFLLGLIGTTHAATPPKCTVQCGAGGRCVFDADRITQKCFCFQGYRLNQTSQCADINECQLSGSVLCAHGACINLEGDYMCDCKDPWVPRFPDGKSCERRQDVGFVGLPWGKLAQLMA